MTDEPRYIITGHANFVATPPEGETSGIFYLPPEPQYVPIADHDALLAWADDAIDALKYYAYGLGGYNKLRDRLEALKVTK